MIKYILKRVGLMCLTFFIIMTCYFGLIKMLPNPIVGTAGANIEALEAQREAWGYNEPIMVQYGIFLKNVFTKFDWGFCTTVGTILTPVTDFIAEKLPPTILVNVFSLVVSIPLGLLFGIYAALKKNKWQDQVISVLIMLFISVPSYVYAFIVQYFLGFKFGLFPLVMKSGTDWLSGEMLLSIVLPVMALSFGSIASLMRYTRAELTETLTSEYMLLARTKGLTRAQATLHHALRNSMVPIFPMIIGMFVNIVGGSMIIEQIFAVPGVGKLFIQSVTNKDYSLFMAISMFYTAIGLITGIIVDISYGIVDPRIRMGGGKRND